MGDPPGLIYPPGYGSGEISSPISVYGDTRGVILLSRGWVWGVHTQWGFTHCQHYTQVAILGSAASPRHAARTFCRTVVGRRRGDGDHQISLSPVRSRGVSCSLANQAATRSALGARADPKGVRLVPQSDGNVSHLEKRIVSFCAAHAILARFESVSSLFQFVFAHILLLVVFPGNGGCPLCR